MHGHHTNLCCRLGFLGSVISLAILGAAIAAAQVAPPGADSKAARSNLNFNFLGGPASPAGQPVIVAGSFTVEKGGRRGVLSVSAVMEPTWHVYSLTQLAGGPQRSTIKVADSAQFKLLGEFQPDRPPHVKPPGVFPVPEEEHEGAVIWSAPIELALGIDPEALTIDLSYGGQVCGGPSGTCIPVSEK